MSDAVSAFVYPRDEHLAPRGGATCGGRVSLQLHENRLKPLESTLLIHVSGQLVLLSESSDLRKVNIFPKVSISIDFLGIENCQAFP